VLELPKESPEKLYEIAVWFAAPPTQLLELRFEVVVSEDDEFELNSQDGIEAIRAGSWHHPLNGRVVQVNRRNVFPFFRARAVLHEL